MDRFNLKLSILNITSTFRGKNTGVSLMEVSGNGGKNDLTASVESSGLARGCYNRSVMKSIRFVSDVGVE